MNNSIDVLHIVENGIELFTVVATGESAVSERGLARMSGVPKSTVIRWFSDLTHPGVPDWLKPLHSIDLHLAHEIKKRGKLIKPISAKAASKFLSLVARNLHNTEAFDTLDAIGEIGLTSFIQAKTGWLPKEYQSSKESRSLIDFILNNPKDWNLHFNSRWQKEACRATGWAWQSRTMAWLIANYIYKPLGEDIYERLLSVNPDRKVRHHQFFDTTADEVVLKEHIQQVGGLLRVSRSYLHFKQLFSDAYSEGIQTEIDLG